jgi:hypothetical protein
MLRFMLIGVLIGIATELGAWALGLWVYRQPQTPVLNVVVMFGVIMGGVASLVRVIGLLPAYWLGFAVGLIYEVLNLRVLKWWDFPGERLAFVRGHTAIILVLAVAWGVVPVVIANAQTAVPRTHLLLGAAEKQLKPRPERTKVTIEARLEQINEKEKRLLEKLEAVRQRERDLESRLEAVRTYKQMLLNRQVVSRPGKPGATPTAIP